MAAVDFTAEVPSTDLTPLRATARFLSFRLSRADYLALDHRHLYAIPVEMLFDLRAAGRYNLWFLAAVASFRVALLIQLLVRFPLIGRARALLCAFLPLTAIVTALSALNLHRVVFSIMGSVVEANRTAHDQAYEVLLGLTLLSWFVFPATAVGYLVSVVLARRPREAPGKS